MDALDAVPPSYRLLSQERLMTEAAEAARDN
jgi:hypothetical protein